MGSSSKNLSENPYVGEAGRREWNDRYGLMAHHTRLWQAAFGMAMIAVVGLTGVVVKVSNESSIKAFAVETNQGIPMTIHPMEEMSDSVVNEAHLVNYAINEFIIDARTVLSDNLAQKRLLTKTYAFAADSATHFLSAYYKQPDNNPFERVAKTTTHVNIVNTLPLSPHTAQVIWDETDRDSMSGEVIRTTRWMANLSYKRGFVKSEFAMDNPFGIYITDLSWSQNQSLGVK